MSCSYTFRHPSSKNSALKEFLEKYTGHKITDKSTLRKNYVSGTYEETISKIRKIIGDGPIWVAMDETTDADGRYIANVIVGKVSTKLLKPFLLYCEELDKYNHKTICKLFNIMQWMFCCLIIMVSFTIMLFYF